MLAQLINRPCLIVHRLSSTTTDSYGNEIPDEDLIEAVCELQQQQRTEPGTEGETSDTKWMLFLPAGTAITTGDSVEVDGHVYEVTGEPWPARNPRTQAESHIEATVRRVAGSEDAS